MKNLLFKISVRATQLFSILLCSTIINTSAQDSWVKKSDLGYNSAGGTEPEHRKDAVGFSIGDKGYVGTGLLYYYTDTIYYYKDFWEYNPENRTWTQKADFGGDSRSGAVGFSIGGKGFVGTGYAAGTSYKDFWEFDPVVNTWTQKADFGGVAREGAAGFSTGTKGYLGTGFRHDGPFQYYGDFWEYDPAADTWTQKADFGGGARAFAVGMSIGDKGYLGTGGPGGSSEDFWEYDPASDTWAQIADFGGGLRREAVGFSIGERGYVGTGYYVDEYMFAHWYKDFWEYDPVTDTWKQQQDLAGIERASTVGFRIGSIGYVVMGAGSNGMTDIYCDDLLSFDPATNTWRKKTNARLGAVGFSIGSKGYVGTGYYFDSYTTPWDTFLRDFWEYDPALNAWTQIADFGGMARVDAVGFSIGNKGYVGTGYGDSLECRNDFWEYDPASNTWTRKADFAGEGRYAAAGFSIGSKGYVGTGWVDLVGYTKDFWEYDPGLNTWTEIVEFGGDARIYGEGFSIGNKGYLGTGYDGNCKKDFWEYDPSAGIWMQKADVGGEVRFLGVGFSIGDKGYLGTGSDENYVYKKDFWEYNPAIDSWSPLTDFGGTARSYAVGFSIGGKGYLGTGADGYCTEDFWEYTPGITAVEELSTVSSIYPNPADEFIIFELCNIAAAQSEIFIYNSGGALLKKNFASHSAQLRIPVDDIGSDGMYFYTVRTNDQEIVCGKFVIQR